MKLNCFLEYGNRDNFIRDFLPPYFGERPRTKDVMILKEKCALIIGASSGIGEATARHLAKEGWTLALVARRENELKRVAATVDQIAGRAASHTFVHDVKNFQEVPALFDTIFNALGGLSLVVYASGVMPKVDSNEYNFDKDREMVEINLLGMIAWLNPTAELFMRLKHGTIVGIGSVAGDRGRKGQPGYNTSKGAQAIFLESLRNRLAIHDVRVITIKPGPVETAMSVGRNMPFMISADEAGRRVVKAAMKSRGTVYVPGRWRVIMAIICSIPSFIFRKLDIE